MVGLAAAAWSGADLAPAACRSLLAAATGIGLVVGGLVGWSRAAGARGFAIAAVAALGGMALMAGSRGAAVTEGHRPLPPGPLPSPVEVLGDPEPIGVAGWRVEVRLPDGHRVDAVAHGRAGVSISRVTVGQSLIVEGRLRALGDRPWLVTRHLVARATITEAVVGGEPGLWRGVVEGVRDRIRAGGDVLDERPRALYHGLVLGDDRFQPPGQTLRFRLAGLTHLLAVSGQNVAFVLAAAAPITGRLGPRPRLVALAVVLIVFALITRLEPSVLRAVSTAGLSAWATLTGRTRSGVGVLAAAVSGLILVDPFLVRSVAFQLSVAASAGILVLTPSLTRLVPGPGWLASPLATGLGAQIGVAPLLSHYFGPVSLVTVPANLAAGWAAAAVMVWGLSLGPVAGMAPTPVASVIQWPLEGLLWWLEAVAAAGARSPDPRPGLGVLAVFAGCALVTRALPIRWPSLVLLALAFVVGVGAIAQAPDRPGSCGDGIRWFPAGGPAGQSVLVVAADAGLRSVESCRRLGVRSVDLVVVEAGDRATGRTVRALVEVVDAGRVVAPPMHSIVGARRRTERFVVATGWGSLVVEPDAGSDGRRLTTRFRATDPGRPGAGP